MSITKSDKHRIIWISIRVLTHFVMIMSDLDISNEWSKTNWTIYHRLSHAMDMMTTVEWQHTSTSSIADGHNECGANFIVPVCQCTCIATFLPKFMNVSEILWHLSFYLHFRSMQYAHMEKNTKTEMKTNRFEVAHLS